MVGLKGSIHSAAKRIWYNEEAPTIKQDGVKEEESLAQEAEKKLSHQSSSLSLCMMHIKVLFFKTRSAP